MRPASVGFDGGFDTTQLCTVPVPCASPVAHSVEWHTPHIGTGGWRSVPHDAHCWRRRRCSRTPSQKYWSSASGVGGITLPQFRPAGGER